MNIEHVVEKDAKIVRRLIDRAHSISRKKDLSYDSFEIDSLLGLINGFPFDKNDALLDFYDYVEEYETGIVTHFLTDLYNNKDYYLMVAHNVIEKIKTSKFEIKKVSDSYNYQTLSRNEMIEILSSFLNEYDENFYKYFLEMLNNGRILKDDFDMEDYGIEGKCFFINSLRKSYIVSNLPDNNIRSLSTIVHELGHSYEFRMLMDKNFETRQGIYATNLNEVSSTFFEVMFYNYLLNNHYKLDETYNLINAYIYLLFEQFYQVYISLISNEYETWENFIYLSEGEFKRVKDNVRETFNMSLVNDKPEIDINSCLTFGMGMLVSLYLYDIYKDDPKYVKKEFENILMSYGLSKDNKVYNSLGISDQKLASANALKKELNRQKEIKKVLHF